MSTDSHCYRYPKLICQSSFLSLDGRPTPTWTSGKEFHILIQHNFSRLVLQYNAYQVEGKHYSTTNSRYQSDTIHTKHSQRPYSHDRLLRTSQHFMQSLSRHWIIIGVWAIIVPPLIPSIRALPRCTHHTIWGNTIIEWSPSKLLPATQLYSLWLTHPRNHHQLINSCSIIIASSVPTSKRLTCLSSDGRIQMHINFIPIKRDRRATYASSSSLLNHLLLIYLTHHISFVRCQPINIITHKAHMFPASSTAWLGSSTCHTFIT
jgi:hypothetical protein